MTDIDCILMYTVHTTTATAATLYKRKLFTKNNIIVKIFNLKDILNMHHTKQTIDFFSHGYDYDSRSKKKEKKNITNRRYMRNTRLRFQMRSSPANDVIY